jgi:hypothetical protein
VDRNNEFIQILRRCILQELSCALPGSGPLPLSLSKLPWEPGAKWSIPRSNDCWFLHASVIKRASLTSDPLLSSSSRFPRRHNTNGNPNPYLDCRGGLPSPTKQNTQDRRFRLRFLRPGPNTSRRCMLQLDYRGDIDSAATLP